MMIVIKKKSKEVKITDTCRLFKYSFSDIVSLEYTERDSETSIDLDRPKAEEIFTLLKEVYDFE